MKLSNSVVKMFLVPYSYNYNAYANLVAHWNSRPEMLLGMESVMQGDPLSNSLTNPSTLVNIGMLVTLPEQPICQVLQWWFKKL